MFSSEFDSSFCWSLYNIVFILEGSEHISYFVQLSVFLGISFPLEGVATIEAYKSHLSFLFANCDSFNVKSQSSLDNFINKWNSTISPNRVKSSVVEDGLVRAKKCATVKLNALKEQGKNGMVMKNLFTFLQFGHTEPFGSYEGAIVTYKESIPVLIYENNSKLAASISVV